jgi:hypothetical protein
MSQSSASLRTNLTPEEHLCAEFMAYFHALLRGGHRLPPYNHAAAVRDFCQAAGHILWIGNKYPSTLVTGLYEKHPLDSAVDRPVPVALRKRPYLTIDEVAVLCFDRIKDALTDDEYWTLLGYVWVSNTKDKNHYHPSYTDLYRRLFSSQRPGRDNLMTPDELKKYRSLPGTVTVYRGCGEKNEAGLSWSLSKETARRFARTWNKPPWFILEGKCGPSDMVAFLDYDHEQELIDASGKVQPTSKMNY